ncbi:hypothetical protein [Tenacibaculum ovolyticum]|uniref:hypothetical protein n=1 Tax=Tenacibaculum ovolyticum TaxID=104270 RepID=UPI000425DED4|nr:hypothetical protein [Tenacibaculum ovolyticum]
MEIKYMKKLEAEKQVGKIAPREPMELKEIKQVEEKFNSGKIFPLAFREYLFLAGKWGGEGIVDPDFDDVREDCEEDLEYCGYSMERPYFVFDILDGQSSIFYLDEEDEDPQIHILDPYGKKRGEFPLVRPNFMGTFSKLINEAIHRIKKDISF